MTNRTALINRVIDQARSYIGFRSRANRVNAFGAGVRQDGKAWNGAFLETVIFEARVSGVPSFTSTVGALAYFNRKNRVFDKPRVGDIVFYGFSQDDDGFGQPHVGLVTEVRDFRRRSTFKAIEGMTASGLVRGPQESDGVYERVRSTTDVLAFARPIYTETPTVPDAPSTTVPVVRPSNIQYGKSSAATVLVQLALHETVGADNLNKGAYDEQTASAVRSYQRHIGLLPTTGLVDDRTLARLAKDTGYRFFVGKSFTEQP